MAHHAGKGGSRTRERILATSLTLFNTEGVNNVSTNHIADAMEISPGNLYYHFGNKDEIILEIFQGFRRRLEQLLMAPSDESMDLEDMWLFLHLLFETIWEFRFLYRNLVDLTARIRSLRIHFRHLIRQKVEAAARMCGSLVDAGVMQASREEVDAAAVNMALVATYWLNFSVVQAAEQKREACDLAPAAYQVLSLLAPYLRKPERDHLRALALAYR